MAKTTTKKLFDSPSKSRLAKFKLGEVVKHRVFPFRGVIFDIDPVFNNTEEWWLSIPENVRPSKDQPFYHLFAENARNRIRRLCVGAEPVARHVGQAGPPSAGRRGVRARRQRRLQAAQRDAELIASVARIAKGPPRGGPLCFVGRSLASGGAPGAAACGGWLSSFLRASSARFCSSSCSFFCCSSNTFGSVGGPS